METKLYIELWESKETGYVIVENMFLEEEISAEYDQYINACKKFGHKRFESLEGYKLSFLLTNVKFDGRKGILKDDVLNSLLKQELIIKVAEGGIFGAYYRKTDKLKDIMNHQLSKRKKLAGVA